MGLHVDFVLGISCIGGDQPKGRGGGTQLGEADAEIDHLGPHQLQPVGHLISLTVLLMTARSGWPEARLFCD